MTRVLVPGLAAALGLFLAPLEPIPSRGLAVYGSADPQRLSLVDATSAGSGRLTTSQAAGCVDSIRDQADPSMCLEASSVPGPGLLFPPPHDGGVNNSSSGANAFVGGGSDNNAGGSHAAIGGGTLNSASDFAFVGGGGFNDAENGSHIGCGFGNFARNNSTIGGGSLNRAVGAWSTVAGGYFNSASGYMATVCGGYQNGAIGYASTVGGGRYNGTSGDASTVSGGVLNSAFASRATVGGGVSNTASATDATVPGGNSNTAAGNYSFAAGRRAKANHSGSFVWGDGQNLDKTSSANDQFNVYAEGGVRVFASGTSTPSLAVDGAGNVGIGTAAPTATLTVSGSICATGSIGACSDACFKTAIEPIGDALSTVLELRGVRFDWRCEEFPERGFSAQRQLGFIAQQVAAVAPEIVHEGADGTLSIDYGKLTPLLVEALREQHNRVAELESDGKQQAERLLLLEETVARLCSEVRALER